MNSLDFFYFNCNLPLQTFIMHPSPINMQSSLRLPLERLYAGADTIAGFGA
jgi:hypothetical protein